MKSWWRIVQHRAEAVVEVKQLPGLLQVLICINNDNRASLLAFVPSWSFDSPHWHTS